MLNKSIPEEQLKKIHIVVLDSDGVCVPRGTVINESEDEDWLIVDFRTSKLSDRLAGKIRLLSKKCWVVVSSGRGLVYLQSIYDKVMGAKTILMAENGNVVMMPNGTIRSKAHSIVYYECLFKIKDEIRKKLFVRGFEPKQSILTVHCDEELEEVYDIVKEYGLGMFKVMWNGEAFDIMSKESSKGMGLRDLLQYFNFTKRNVIAIGDRINDKELLEEAGIGISADKEKLPAKYWTTGSDIPGEQLIDYLLENFM